MGLSLIALTVRAVNFLELIVDSGYPVLTYFKYLIPYEDIVFNKTKSKINSIYIINNEKDEIPSIEKVKNQQECLLRVRNQLYRPRFIRSLGKEIVSFNLINNLIKKTNIFKLTLPFGIKEMQCWLEQISL